MATTVADRTDASATPQTGEAARLAIRRGHWTGPTAGLAPGFVQGNLAILPAELASDFMRSCQLNPKPCPLLAVGALWMLFHAIAMLTVRRMLRAPVFFLAVGSQANIGGAASAPVVAAAFHPALATVGVLLAVLGYVLGTYVGILVAFVLRQVAAFYGG